MDEQGPRTMLIEQHCPALQQVTNETTGAVAMFPCSRWIHRQEGEAAVTAIATTVGPGSPPPPPREDTAAGGDDQADGPEAQPGYQVSFHTSR